MDDLRIDHSIPLRNPHMVVAFTGWSNAADITTRTIDHLRVALEGVPCGTIEIDHYNDYTNARPVVQIQEGLVESVTLPRNQFYACQRPDSVHDVLLFSGVEPALHWNEFLDTFVTAAQEWDVSLVVSLGGLYDRVPHTRPVRISGVASDTSLRARLRRYGCTPTNYSGPSSIHTSLLIKLRDAGIPSVSLWGHAPSYAQVAWNPRVSESLLRCVGRLLHLSVDVRDVVSASDYLDEMLRKAMTDNPDLRDHVLELEKEFDSDQDNAPAAASSEVIIREVEELLRQQRDRPIDG